VPSMAKLSQSYDFPDWIRTFEKSRFELFIICVALLRKSWYNSVSSASNCGSNG